MERKFWIKKQQQQLWQAYNIIAFLSVLFAIHPLTSDLYASYFPGVLVRARNVQHYLGPACTASL